MELYDYAYKLTYYNYPDEDMRDDIYRAELLNVFKLEDFHETHPSDKVTEIYNSIKQIESINNLATQLAAGYDVMDDPSFGMVIIFGYETFHMIHKVLKDFFEKGTVNEEDIESIKKHLEK